MLSYTDLKPGTQVVLDGEPYVVMEYHFLRKQQRKPTVQTKIKHLVTGRVVERAFQPSDNIIEAEVELKDVKFLYHNKEEYWFCEVDNPKNRFKLDFSVIGSAAGFLKDNSLVSASVFKDKIININLPIKVDLLVTEAPPAIKGNTAQGGTKQVMLETGANVNVPLFVGQGDVVRINTQTGEYVERVSKFS